MGVVGVEVEVVVAAVAAVPAVPREEMDDRCRMPCVEFLGQVKTLLQHSLTAYHL